MAKDCSLKFGWIASILALVLGLSLGSPYQDTAHAALDAVTWTSQQDFESNGSTTGDTTTRADVDTHTSSGDLKLGPPQDRVSIPNLRGGAGMTVVTPVNHRVYAVGNGTVSVYEQATGELRKIITVDPDAWVLAYNSVNNTIFVAGYFGVVNIIDCATDEVVKTFAADTAAAGIAYNPDRNKIYLTNNIHGRVTVLNGATGAVLSQLSIGSAHAPAYNSNSGVLYVNGLAGVTAIDCATDQVLRSVDVARFAKAMAYNPRNNKLYIGQYDSIYILDCATFTLVKTLNAPYGNMNSAVAFNSVNNKIYVGSTNSYEDESNFLIVVDCATDVITKQIGGYSPGSVTYDPNMNMAIVSSSGKIFHLDGATEQRLSENYLSIQPASVAYDSFADRMYVTSLYNKLYAIDPANYAILKTIDLPFYGGQAVYSKVANKVYVAHPYNNTMSVVDCATNTVIRTFSLGISPSRVAVNDVQGKVYAITWNGTIVVIDCATDSIAKTFSIGKNVYSAAFATTSSRLFLITQQALTVLDGASDTVLQTVPVSGGASNVSYDVNRNRVYVTASSANMVYAFDAATLALTSSFTSPSPYQIGYNPYTDKIYTTQVWDMNLQAVTTVSSGSSFETLGSFTRPSYGDDCFVASQHYNKAFVANQSGSSFFEISQFAPTGNLGGSVGLRVSRAAEMIPVRLKWSHDVLPATQKIRFQVRTASDVAGLGAARYLGPDGTSDTWYEATTAGAATVDAEDGQGKVTSVPLTGNPNFAFQLPPFRAAELQVTLVSDGNTPVVRSVSLEFEKMDPPSMAQLAQYKADGITTLPARTNQGSLMLALKNIAGLSLSTAFHAEFEVKRLEAPFDGSSIVSGTTVAPGETSSVAVTVTSEGGYKWRARVVDQAGRASAWTEFSTALPAFTFDITPPSFTLNAQTISGSVEALAGIGVTAVPPAIAGAVGYQGDTGWSCTISNLAPGANPVTITAVDEAGNIRSATVQLFGLAAP